MINKRMRRILLAWELGGGMGHASRLLKVAVALRKSGFIPIVAAANPNALKERYIQCKIPIIQAPINKPTWYGKEEFKASSYSDLLGIGGFAKPPTLQRVIGEWHDIFQRYQPDLIIADYAPLLSLACFGRIPVICFGDGFVVPHAQDGHFLNLREGTDNVWSEQELLNNAHQALQSYTSQMPNDLTELVKGQAQVVSVIRELDIYGDYRNQAYGPLSHDILPKPPTTQYHLFVYLHNKHPLTAPILNIIAQHHLSADCLVIGADHDTLSHWARQGINILQQASNIEEMLARAAVCVHHGGINMMEEAILAGRFQVLLPRHFEQRLNMQRAITQIKACVAVARHVRSNALEKLLLEELNNPERWNSAMDKAKQVEQRPTSMFYIIEQISRLLT